MGESGQPARIRPAGGNHPVNIDWHDGADQDGEPPGVEIRRGIVVYSDQGAFMWSFTLHTPKMVLYCAEIHPGSWTKGVG